MVRGGGWDGYAFHCRVAHRSERWPALRNFKIGFRSVLPPGQPGEGEYYEAYIGPVTVDTRCPVITVQPQSQTVYPGETVTFSVTATGAPPLTYQWQFNGNNLADNGRVAGSQANQLTLISIFKRVTPVRISSLLGTAPAPSPVAPACSPLALRRWA